MRIAKEGYPSNTLQTDNNRTQSKKLLHESNFNSNAKDDMNKETETATANSRPDYAGLVSTINLRSRSTSTSNVAGRGGWTTGIGSGWKRRWVGMLQIVLP